MEIAPVLGVFDALAKPHHNCGENPDTFKVKIQMWGKGYLEIYENRDGDHSPSRLPIIVQWFREVHYYIKSTGWPVPGCARLLKRSNLASGTAFRFRLR